MRPVATLKPVYTGARITSYENDREGGFHGWGVEYEEFENGPANYTVAIIEFPDGSIETVMPQRIQFLDSKDASERALNDYLSEPPIVF